MIPLHKYLGRWSSFRFEAQNHSWLYIWVSLDRTWRINRPSHELCLWIRYWFSVNKYVNRVTSQWTITVAYLLKQSPSILFILECYCFSGKVNYSNWCIREQPLISSVPLSLCLSAGLWDFKHRSAHWENSGRPSKSGEHWNRCLRGRCFRCRPVSLHGWRCGEGEYGEYLSDQTLKCLTENWKMFLIKQQNVGE